MDPTNGFAYEADERWANPVDLMKKNVNAEAVSFHVVPLTIC